MKKPKLQYYLLSSFTTFKEYILCRNYLSCYIKSGIMEIYQTFHNSRTLKTYLCKVNKYWKNRKIWTMSCNRRSCLIFDFIYDTDIFPTKSWCENWNLKSHTWLEYSANILSLKLHICWEAKLYLKSKHEILSKI